MPLNPEVRRIALFIFGKDLVYVMLPLIAGIIVAVAGYQQFTLANWGIVAGMVWLEGHWLLSPFLAEKRHASHRGARRVFWEWAVSVSLLICLIGTGGFCWVRFMHFSFERDDVFNKLALDVATEGQNVYKTTQFTITNNGGSEISKKHEIACMIREAWNPEATVKLIDHLTVVQGTSGFHLMGANNIEEVLRAPIPEFVPIAGGGGDGQSDSCLALFGNLDPQSTTACIDLRVEFIYSLTDQPSTLEHKPFRLVGFPEGGSFKWKKEPYRSQKEYCEEIMQHQQ